MPTLEEIAGHVDGRIEGDPATTIRGLATLEDAGPDDLTFVSAEKYLARLADSAAGAVLRPSMLDGPSDRPTLVVENLDQALIRLLAMFAPETRPPETGVHPTAWVHDSVRLGDGVCIGPHVSIEMESEISDGVILHAGVRIGDRVKIGAGSELHPGSVVLSRCVLGRGVILHANAVIGADGFGYAPAPHGHGMVKIPHIGHVIIEDGVEIGANSCVDRGKIGATFIGAGTKIDDLVMIGHNCRIGRCCVIAGWTGLAGSITLGDGVTIGGGVGIADHVTLGAGVTVGGKSGIMNDIAPGETVLGLPASPIRETLRQWAAIRKLPGLIRDLSGRKMPDALQILRREMGPQSFGCR